MKKIYLIVINTLLFFVGSTIGGDIWEEAEAKDVVVKKTLWVDDARSSHEILATILTQPNKAGEPFLLKIYFAREIVPDRRTAILDEVFTKLVKDYPAIVSNLVKLKLNINQLRVAPDFTGLHNLKSLNLYGNELHEMPALPPSLMYLNLEKNKFNKAPNFAQLPQLKAIDLSDNPLSHPVIISCLLRDQFEIRGVPAGLLHYERPPQQALVKEPKKLPELERLIQHMQVMQELKNREKEAVKSHEHFALRMPVKTPTTTTDAWFNYFDVQFPYNPESAKATSNRIASTANTYAAQMQRNSVDSIIKTVNDYMIHMQKNPAFKKVFELAIQRERIFAETHFPFYHANNTASEAFFDIIQYTIDLAYILKSSPASGLKLRIPRKDAYENVSLTQWYRDNFISPTGMLESSDRMPHIQDALLSTNVSLFGNASIGATCTWDLFINTESIWPRYARQIAIQIAALFGIEPKDPLCYDLEETLDIFTESLNQVYSLHQIFIAKKSVNDHVVLTKSYGVPLLERNVLPEARDSEKFLDVRTILQRYINDFGSLIDGNRIQGRIRFTPELILNDTDDIIHYTYHVPENVFEQPEIAKAREGVHQVIRNMLIKSLDNPSNSPLTTATRLRQLIEQADQKRVKHEKNLSCYKRFLILYRHSKKH